MFRRYENCKSLDKEQSKTVKKS